MKNASEHPLLVNKKKLTFFDIVLLITQIITAPIIVPVRGIAVLVIAYLYGASCWLATLGTNSAKSLSAKRKKVARFIFAFYNRLFCYVFGLHIRAVGKQDKKARILIGNHTSILDVITGPATVFGSPIAKKNDKFWPVKQCAILSRALILNRDFNKNNSQTNNMDVRQQLIDRCNDTSAMPVVLFPEGTTCDPNYTLKFKPFAFTVNQPIQMFSIRYKTLIRTPWTCQSMPSLLLQMFMNWGGVVTVKFVPQVMQQNNTETVEGFIERVRQLYKQELNNTQTEYSVNDVVLFFEMRQNKPVQHSEQYQRDFGWMGSYRNFCKKYKFSKLQQNWGLRTYMVRNIKPTE